MTRDAPTFRYPWTELETFLKDSGVHELSLLGYGSLMNPKSAAITIPRYSQASIEPILGYGIKRYFNLRMPESALRRYGNPETPKHVAALNVVWTGNREDTANGVLVRIRRDDIEALRTREVGYNLVPTHAAEWETRRRIDEPVFSLQCPQHEQSILPHLGYLHTCEDGAKAISSEFLAYFRRSTFLGDHTSLADWRCRTNA